MNPLVSVIVPTYNRWPMVTEAVDSVLGQSMGDFELIVVDDGSEDGTAEKLASYGASLSVISQPRRGVAAARNLGVSRSSGRYIAFLDSDDLWLPKKLEAQLGFMESRPGIEICQTEEIWLRQGVRVNPKARHRKPSGDIFRRSLELCLVSPSAVMMTRSLFDRSGGFDESFPVCEDYELWLRIAVNHRVPLLPVPLVIKRGGHPGQLSRSVWGLDRFRILALRKLIRSGLAGERRRWAVQVLARKVGIVAGGARKRGKEDEARKYEAILAEFSSESIGSTESIGSRFDPIDPVTL